MTTNEARRFVAVLLVLFGFLGACSVGGEPDVTTDMPDSGASVCTANATVNCMCIGGGAGQQLCNANGTGYVAPCVCGGGTGCEACTPQQVCMGGRCVAMTNPCTNRECGSNGSGGSCGACPSPQVCNEMLGRCFQPTCTPTCSGRQCGPDPTCGMSCGTCPAGQPCSATGQCVAPPACIPIGEPCVTGSTCCADSTTHAIGTCIAMPGLGTFCAAPCTSGSGCTSGCCVATTSGTSVCAIPEWCPSPSCTIGAFANCTSSTDLCCNDTIASSNRPTSCTTVGMGPQTICAPLCLTNADCDTITSSSGAWHCVPRSDHVLVCVP